MAKKKNVEPDEDLEEDLSDLEDDKFESVYPEVTSKTQDKVKDTDLESELAEDEKEEEEEEEELEDEDLPEIQDYNYLKLNLIRKTLENDYELEIIGQSHGFCNTFIRHLLNIEGVNIAAYKDIRIEPSKIFIRLENKKYKIKDILFKGIESLREDVLEVQNLFK